MEDLKISRILHAGYVFQLGNTRIAFDPVFENPFSQNCYAFPEIQFDFEKIKALRFDAVFISHYHDDHCSFESLNLLDRETPIYLYCIFDELFYLIKQLGFKYVFPIEIGLPISVGSFKVIPCRALDADVDSIFHVQVAGLNILNVVDSWIEPVTMNRLSSFAPWDLVLWPFQTMREIEVLSPRRAPKVTPDLPAEWLEQMKMLKPKNIVPSSCQFRLESWSWYNEVFFPISYELFQREVEGALPQSKVIRMNPGTTFTLDQKGIKSADQLDWIKPLGAQDVDYVFKPEMKPPTTSQIATQFPQLEENEKQIALRYCSEGLLERIKIQPPESPYFLKAIVWMLSVYDHLGASHDFYYKLSGTNIELLSVAEATLGWRTEIPLFKLYSALENGEALTSLYMRINDLLFDPETETELEDVDIVEDPLIRSLYNGEFAAYQKAQLKRIKT